MAEAKTRTTAVKEPEVAKEKTVKIRIPRNRKDEDDVFVSVNERTWLIKRGVEVEVPECVPEVLRHQEEALEQAYEFETAAKEN